ncbi:MAG: chorismate mutase, partial [Firmicutes bacterium]|nr:chorismate mutase [Bacillota bacterium]
FSATPDLTAAFPAAAARELGWTHVPLFDTVEIDVPGALPMCIRVLMHVNTQLCQADVKHIYLREARLLRPDLTSDNT